MKDQRPNHVASGSEFLQDHTQRDQREGAEALNGQQEAEELASEVAADPSRERHAQKKTHLRGIERSHVSLLHGRKLNSAGASVKAANAHERRKSAPHRHE